ncbi:MAG TPA: hypothetical protein VIJ52_02595 [Pseudolabrys sp.]
MDVDFYIRANTIVGGAEDLPIEDAEWEYHPDETVDIAATLIGLNGRYFDQLTLPLSKTVKQPALGCGQRIHIVGLFRMHFGKKRNIPIVHTGHIAALADPQEKIPIENRTTGETILVESHLVEAQTLEGLSGSPVFVQEYISWHADLADGSGHIFSGNVGAFGPMSLLGVYQGAWDGRPGAILAADRNVSGDQRIPLGMGMVVPIERVTELIQGNDTLKKHREGYKKAERAKKAAKMDSGFSEQPATEANPNHREDFTSLASAAAQKRKPTE